MVQLQHTRYPQQATPLLLLLLLFSLQQQHQFMLKAAPTLLALLQQQFSLVKKNLLLPLLTDPLQMKQLNGVWAVPAASFIGSGRL